MIASFDMSNGVTEAATSDLGCVLTAISQQVFSDEILELEGRRPSKQRIARLYGKCVIPAESEAI